MKKTIVKQIHKEEELGYEVEIDLAKAIKEFKEQYHGATDRFLTDLTVFIRRNIDYHQHTELVNMNEEEKGEFYSWGSNSRYKNVFEPLLYERFEEAIENLEEYLNIKVDMDEDEERADLIYEYEIKIAKAKRNNDTEAQYYYQDKLNELLREDDLTGSLTNKKEG